MDCIRYKGCLALYGPSPLISQGLVLVQGRGTNKGKCVDSQINSFIAEQNVTEHKSQRMQGLAANPQFGVLNYTVRRKRRGKCKP